MRAVTMGTDVENASAGHVKASRAFHNTWMSCFFVQFAHVCQISGSSVLFATYRYSSETGSVTLKRSEGNFGSAS